MSNTSFRRSSGNVFSDIGFAPRKAAMLAAKSALVDEIAKVVSDRRLTFQKAASLCKADGVLFSQVLRGRIDVATFDMLVRWLRELGLGVEFRVL